MSADGRYATICADPPWDYGGRKWNGFAGGRRQGGPGWNRGLPYPPMSLEAIRALPVDQLAAPAAHLYLWTTQRHLWDARAVIEAWGFPRRPPIVLTWCKRPRGLGLGDAFTPTAEFVLFAHRGGLRPQRRHDSTWFEGARGQRHSEKPAAFLEIVERVSPGPYVELFSRATETRPGWAYWGDESLATAGMPEAA